MIESTELSSPYNKGRKLHRPRVVVAELGG